MKRALILLVLSTGCGEPGLSMLTQTVLPAVDCTAEDPPPPTLMPLRAQLLGAGGAPSRGESLAVVTEPADHVWVIDRSAIEAVNAPSGGDWDPVFADGSIYTVLSGTIDAEAQRVGTLSTGPEGEAASWIRVDHPGICASGVPFDTATVALRANGAAANTTLVYRDTPRTGIDLALPSCEEMAGQAALYITSPDAGPGTVSWSVGLPRFTALVPESVLPAEMSPRTVAGLDAFVTADPSVADDYLPTFAEIPRENRDETVWLRVDVRELCGEDPPTQPLPVWISTDTETTLWRLG